MMRAGQSGIVYVCWSRTMWSRRISFSIGRRDPKESKQVFFDNWFSALPLLIKLQSMGILSTATLHSNRVAGCPRMSNKDLKATGYGSFDYGIDSNSLLHVVKWYDNKRVILGLSFSTVKASSTKRRQGSKKKDHCNVVYPDMVKEYNESMGGVDLNGKLISLHHVDIQTRKIWYLNIITYLVNIFNVNGWLLYRRYSEELRVPKKN